MARSSAFGGMGLGHAEARYWHRRIYSGMVRNTSSLLRTCRKRGSSLCTQAPLTQVLPTDIGAAAAYEVWRNWRYNYGILAQPLSGDAERQREALVGLAIGEGPFSSPLLLSLMAML